VTLCDTGSPAPTTANSTSAYTSWPSLKSAKTPREGPTTFGNEPTARIIKEAMRSQKRRLSDVVYRQLIRYATGLGAGSEGHSGGRH
jgi:hypothetical protein